ncbi:MAG: histidinol-phosphatase [Pseudomonadota bacterium]
MDICFPQLERVALACSTAAREAILPHFRSRSLQADNKDQNGYDPVTIADRAAETAIRTVLTELRPDDAILGEEHGRKSGSTGLTWVLDPIDGTRGFVSGTPTWGVLIAVTDASGPVFGLISQPYIGEHFVGFNGSGWTDGPAGRTDLRTRAARPLDEATVLTTFPEVGSPLEARAFNAVARRARLTRYGMDCYGYALLAAGQVDLVIEAGLQAYDICAPIAVIEGAGGIVTDWRGGPAHGGGTALAAANPEIHAEALAILRGEL